LASASEEPPGGPTRAGPPTELPWSPAIDLDAKSWLALMLLGAALFLGGVYLGFAASGKVASALGKSGIAIYLPYVLTIVGGALSVYAYEAWYQHPDGPGGRRRRRETLKNMPSFVVYPPGGRKDP
jgi:uncharacterized membrane protein YedE/YeeE